MPNLYVAVAAFVVALLLPATGNAQRGTAGLALESRAPLVRLNDSNALPIVIRDVSIDAEIIGREARSRIELRIGNPNPRVLEGELQFPLLDGQVVSGFALDIDGRLRDAVAVPKARGQEIFEDIRRRNVDPALLEATASNQYKLRVYPIPAKGERRVVLWISERLEIARGRALLRMPLTYSNELERLRVSLVAMGLKQQEVTIRSAPQDTTLFAEPDRVVVELKGNRWASASARDTFIAIDIAIPNRDRLLVGETEGRRYAVADIPFVDEPVRRIEPKHIALIWDASASAKSQTRAIGVLDSFFARLTGTAKVTLLVVRNQVDLVESFAVDRRSWDALRRQIEREPFDGSSNFDQLAIPETVDLAVLVSDGLATDGERRIGYTHRAPLVALNAALVADAPRLRRLAERTGGRYVDLGARSLGDAADEMWRDGWRVERVTGSSSTRCLRRAPRMESSALLARSLKRTPT
jgi:Ca-activated chloride channel homolog